MITKPKANIVIVGPSNSGKTSFLETVSMTSLVEIDYRESGELVESNAPGSVEYGAYLTPDVDVELRSLPVCNTEDLDILDLNWKIGLRGAEAAVLLLPADAPRSFLTAHRMYDRIQQQLDGPVLIGVTRSDEGLLWDKSEISEWFHTPTEFIVDVDPRDYTSVLECLDYLFELLPLTVFRNSTESLSESLRALNPAPLPQPAFARTA